MSNNESIINDEKSKRMSDIIKKLDIDNLQNNVLWFSDFLDRMNDFELTENKIKKGCNYASNKFFNNCCLR